MSRVPAAALPWVQRCSCCCRYCGEFMASRYSSLAALPRRRSKGALRYASTHSSARADENLSPWPRGPNPTPYEILGVDKHAPYTKSRFYRLVKMYHPDTHQQAALSPHQRAISSATRLERYRLVIAANEILSDPAKRRLYDTRGIGWTHAAGARESSPRSTSPRSTGYGEPFRRRENVYNNGTWEDWERWYRQQNRQQPREDPFYMSNGTFAAVVVMLCMIGALAQMTRAERLGASAVQAVRARNEEIGKGINRRTIASAGLTRDQRVDGFLRDRENIAYSYRPDTHQDGPQSGKTV